MNIYIAAHNQAEAKLVAVVLTIHGHVITSRWLDKPFRPTRSYFFREREGIAQMDFDDVVACDALVLLCPPGRRRSPGGKFVEAGIALGLGRRVYVMGPRENMLLWHPRIIQVPHCRALVSHLADNPSSWFHHP